MEIRIDSELGRVIAVCLVLVVITQGDKWREIAVRYKDGLMEWIVKRSPPRRPKK